MSKILKAATLALPLSFASIATPADAQSYSAYDPLSPQNIATTFLLLSTMDWGEDYDGLSVRELLDDPVITQCAAEQALSVDILRDNAQSVLDESAGTISAEDLGLSNDQLTRLAECTEKWARDQSLIAAFTAIADQDYPNTSYEIFQTHANEVEVRIEEPYFNTCLAKTSIRTAFADGVTRGDIEPFLTCARDAKSDAQMLVFLGFGLMASLGLIGAIVISDNEERKRRQQANKCMALRRTPKRSPEGPISGDF